MENYFLLYLSLIALACDFASSYYIPPYVVPCRKSDPDLQKCALEHGQKAIPYLTRGDKKIKLRSLDPLDIPKINIDTGGNLKLDLTDSKLYGLGQMQLRNVSVDLDKQSMFLDMYNENITIEGTYNISGHILILPITGSGSIRASIKDGLIGYFFKYDLIKKDGVTYLSPNPPAVTLEATSSTYHLENLFNGDKRLGEEMNKFLNENHEVMFKEISPSVRETISWIAQDIVRKVLSNVPYENILIP